MAERMQIRTEVDSELHELKQDVALEVVSDEIEEQARKAS